MIENFMYFVCAAPWVSFACLFLFVLLASIASALLSVLGVERYLDGVLICFFSLALISGLFVFGTAIVGWEEINATNNIPEEKLLKAEIEYRLGGQKPVKSAFSYMLDDEIILRASEIKRNEARLARIFEPEDGKALSQARGSIEEKRVRIEQALREKEQAKFEELLASATPKERDEYIRVLETRRRKLDDFIKRLGM